jgi:hypothetical protein
VVGVVHYQGGGGNGSMCLTDSAAPSHDVTTAAIRCGVMHGCHACCGVINSNHTAAALAANGGSRLPPRL